MKLARYQDVLDFWFSPENADLLFEKNDDFDSEIRQRFGKTWEAACAGLLWEWRDHPYGRLAEIIVLDQFSRNLCRGDAKSFTQDTMALVLAQELYQLPEFEEEFSIHEKCFAMMPFMHSESAEIHETALRIFTEIGDENTLHYENLHKDIIDRFGRYPHRNDALGRETTPEEAEFLTEPDSSF